MDYPIRKSVDDIRFNRICKGSLVCLWMKRNSLLTEQNKREGKIVSQAQAEKWRVAEGGNDHIANITTL